MASELIASRLYFKVKTAQATGRQQLRVHLYHRALLVQALNITAWIGSLDANSEPLALMVETDYVLSGSLDQHQLLELGEHTLRIFANESPGSMCGFRFYGHDGAIASSATVESAQIGTLQPSSQGVLVF